MMPSPVGPSQHLIGPVAAGSTTGSSLCAIQVSLAASVSLHAASHAGTAIFGATKCLFNIQTTAQYE